MVIPCPTDGSGQRTGVQLRAPEGALGATDKLVGCNALLDGALGVRLDEITPKPDSMQTVMNSLRVRQLMKFATQIGCEIIAVVDDVGLVDGEYRVTRRFGLSWNVTVASDRN
jgi:hypothetical protein